MPCSPSPLWGGCFTEGFFWGRFGPCCLLGRFQGWAQQQLAQRGHLHPAGSRCVPGAGRAAGGTRGLAGPWWLSLGSNRARDFLGVMFFTSVLLGASSAPCPRGREGALCSAASPGAGPPARNPPLCIAVRGGEAVNINPVAKQGWPGIPTPAPSPSRGEAARARAGAGGREA